MQDIITVDVESIYNPISEWREAHPNDDRMPPPHAQRAISVCSLHLVQDVENGGWNPVFRDFGPAPEKIPAEGEAVDEVAEYYIMRRLGDRLTDVVSNDGVVVTYNGRGFDIPLLYARMLAFGIPAPWYTYDFRYRFSIKSHIDIMDVLCDYGAVFRSRPGLSVMSKLFGLPGKMGIDGSMVAKHYEDGKYHEIREYCLGDNFETGIIILRWLLVKGKIDLEMYRDTVRKILVACYEKNNEGVYVHPFLAEMADRSDKRRLLLGVDE